METDEIKLIQQTCTLSDGTTISLTLRYHPNPILKGLVILLHGRLHTSKKGPCSELIERLNYSSIIYDARGMGESGGQSGYSNIEEEVNDLEEVIEYIKSNLEAPHDKVLAIIGHSKGAVVGLTYLSRSKSINRIDQPKLYDERLRLPLLITLSIRYDHQNQDIMKRFNKEQEQELLKNGKFVWLRYKAGKNDEERRDYLITNEDINKAIQYDLDPIIEQLSLSLTGTTRTNEKQVQMCLLHGKSDGTVSYQQTIKLDQKLKKIKNISHDLFLIEGVQHNWNQINEIEFIGNLINHWIKFKAGFDFNKVNDLDLVDHFIISKK